MLHGGPGLSHHYVLPFKELHTRFNISVIFYDQIGIGESSHPNVPAEFWTVDLFMDELDNVLERLGIRTPGATLISLVTRGAECWLHTM